MTVERKRAMRLARLLHQIEAIEELNLAEINRNVENQLEAEIGLVGQLSNNSLNDVRFLRSLSRRLHLTSTALSNERQRQNVQKIRVSSAKVRKVIVDKRLSVLNSEHARKATEDELSRTLELTLAQSLIQRPASSQ